MKITLMLTHRMLGTIRLVLALLALAPMVVCAGGEGGIYLAVDQPIKQVRDTFDGELNKLTIPLENKGDDKAEAWVFNGGCLVFWSSKSSKKVSSMEYRLPAKIGDVKGKILYTLPLENADLARRTVLVRIPVVDVANEFGLVVKDFYHDTTTKDEALALMKAGGYTPVEQPPMAPLDASASEMLAWKVLDGILLTMFSTADDKHLLSVHYLLTGVQPGAILHLYEVGAFDPKHGWFRLRTSHEGTWNTVMKRAGEGDYLVSADHSINEVRDAFDNHGYKKLATPMGSKGDDMSEAWEFDGGCMVVRSSKSSKKITGMEYRLPTFSGYVNDEILYTLPLENMEMVHHTVQVRIRTVDGVRDIGLSAHDGVKTKEEVTAVMKTCGYAPVKSLPVEPLNASGELLAWKVLNGILLARFSTVDGRALRSLHYLLPPGSKSGSNMRIYEVGAFVPQHGWFSLHTLHQNTWGAEMREK